MTTTTRTKSALVVGAGGGGVFTTLDLLEHGFHVHQVSHLHLRETTLQVAAGLIEPVGGVNKGYDHGHSIGIDPAEGTARMMEWCREHISQNHRGIVGRNVMLLAENERDLDVSWATAVDGFAIVEPPAGQNRYEAAASFKSFVVQPDFLLRQALTTFRDSGRWTYERARFVDLDEVHRYAASLDPRPDCIVIAAGINAGDFDAKSAADGAIGIVAKHRHDRRIDPSRRVTIATTESVFPYEIPGYNVSTYGGTFLEGFDADEVAQLHIDDFREEQRMIIERLAELGLVVPAEAVWKFGARPIHAAGPHAWLDLGGPVPVVHISGLSGSGITFGPAIGEAAQTLAARALDRGEGRVRT